MPPPASALPLLAALRRIGGEDISLRYRWNREGDHPADILFQRLTAGSLTAWGRPGTPTAAWAKIPTAAWAVVEVRHWPQGALRFLDALWFEVLVVGIEPARRASKPELSAWYLELYRSGRVVSEEVDWAAAEAHFGGSISREKFREVRREILPPEARQPGRPKKTR